MDELPLCSVCIVTRNRRKYVLRALKSVMSIDYPNTEVILIDNNSSDNTPHLVKTEFPSVNVTELEENIGCPPARNVAMEQASGEYILHLDDDAMLSSGALTCCHRVFSGDMSPDILALNIVENGISRLQKDADPFRTYTFPGGASCFRRTTITAIGQYDKTLFRQGEEYDYSLRCFDRGLDIVAVPEAVVFHDPPSRQPDDILPRVYANRMYVLIKNYPIVLMCILGSKRIPGFLYEIVTKLDYPDILPALQLLTEKCLLAYKNRSPLLEGCREFHKRRGDSILSRLI